MQEMQQLTLAGGVRFVGSTHTQADDPRGRALTQSIWLLQKLAQFECALGGSHV